MEEEEGLPAGVRALDHTADLGVEVEAPTLALLFDRAAAGVMALAEQAEADRASGAEEERSVSLEAADVALLLAEWLREVVYLQAVEGWVYRSAAFDRLEPGRLEARMRLVRVSGPPVREIKGVTYHGLEVTPSDDGWRARVILDV